MRVGLYPLLGLVFPALGDALSGMVSLSVLFLAAQYRVIARVLDCVKAGRSRVS